MCTSPVILTSLHLSVLICDLGMMAPVLHRAVVSLRRRFENSAPSTEPDALPGSRGFHTLITALLMAELTVVSPCGNKEEMTKSGGGLPPMGDEERDGRHPSATHL